MADAEVVSKEETAKRDQAELDLDVDAGGDDKSDASSTTGQPDPEIALQKQSRKRKRAEASIIQLLKDELSKHDGQVPERFKKKADVVNLYLDSGLGLDMRRRRRSHWIGIGMRMSIG